MKIIKKIGVMVMATFLLFSSRCFADSIDPRLENRRMREINNNYSSFSTIDAGDILKITIIGILVLILIAIVAFTIYKIVKTNKENNN